MVVVVVVVVPLLRKHHASVMGNGLVRRLAHDAPCPSSRASGWVVEAL